MLHLKRIVLFNELLKCKVSGELIGPGDFYYEDDEDGLIVKASVYRRYKDQKIRQEWDYSLLNQATSEREYRQLLLRLQKDFFAQTLFDRKIAGKEVY